MPIKKSHGGRVLVAAVLAAIAVPGSASAATFDEGACPTPTLSQPFTGIGDDNRYFLAPGGDFEQAGVWTMDGANEYTASDRPDAGEWGGSTALQLADGTATSPTFCVDGTYPHIRVAAKAGTDTGLLTVDAVLEDGTTVPLRTLPGSEFQSWSYSRYVPLAGAVGLSLDQATQLKLRVQVVGDWTLDAISVDPRKGA
jgi:hypothetical protein